MAKKCGNCNKELPYRWNDKRTIKRFRAMFRGKRIFDYYCSSDCCNAKAEYRAEMSEARAKRINEESKIWR